jgi:hypothetical protein
MKKVIEVIEKEIQRLEVELNEFKRALDYFAKKTSVGKLVTKEMSEVIRKEVIDIEGVLCDKEAYDYLNQFTVGTDVTMKLLKSLTLSNVVSEYIEEHKKQKESYPDAFGFGGKMSRIGSNKYDSGISWCDTKQGSSFWREVLIE